MHTETQLGRNRTGIQMSPIDTAKMEAAEEEMAPMHADQRGDLAVRREYASSAGDEGLGSVPVPGTMKGMLSSGMDMLTGKRPQALVDRLGERLAFERGGVRLYDTLLAKCSVDGTALSTDEQAMLVTFRNQEAEHFNIVADALRSLGADPTAQTPCADLVGVESMGLVQAMNDPRSSVLQSLHVMLDAELIDNAGWELLIQLARGTGHDAIADGFERPMQQEAVHLQHLRALVGRLTLEDAGRDRDTAQALDTTGTSASMVGSSTLAR